ncbi:MAG: uracil-DNA glycosylase [Candidatus Portnoybacteria bacterium]|nr:uracil-DNA glycosylase [Candidatus Portnoybacteria bacterium]
MNELKETKELRKVKEDLLNCKECPLYEERVKGGFFPVIGEGNHQADIMLVGEAPGLNEAKSGRPFCGAAGRILDKLLESAGMKREEIYITNVVKDRPPNNRDPRPEEIEAYGPFLERQIRIIKPKIIGCLGNFSTAFMFNKYGLEKELKGISKLHGKVFSVNDLKIAPLYHPAVAVYNNKMTNVLIGDFKKIKGLV